MAAELVEGRVHDHDVADGTSGNMEDDLAVLVAKGALAAVGGAGGVLVGIGISVGYATVQSWPMVISPLGIGGGLAAALTIGAGAGLYPAMRAAGVAPTEALRSS